MKHKKTIKTLLKIIISGFALYYVFSHINLHNIARELRSAHSPWLLAALLCYALSQVAAAFRLKVLFQRIPIGINHLENIRLYWLGLFYNLFLPGGVGGDGFKVYLLGRHLKSDLRKTLGAILSDRISGLTVIVVFLLVLLPFLDYPLPLKEWAWTGIPLVMAAFWLFLRLFNASLLPAWAPTFGWALLAQLLQMTAALFLLKSLPTSAGEPYNAYLFLFFLSAIAGSVPITLGGIGARELVFLWGAQYLGINEDTAVALSLLFYVASAVTALPGLVFTFQPGKILRRHTPKQQA